MIRSVSALILLMTLSLATQASQPAIVTSIHPLALVVKELVGDNARVTTLVPASISPHNYSMKPSQRRRLEQADLFVWLGPRMEPFLANTMDDQRLKQKSLALDNAPADPQPHEGHAHGHDQEDPHIWLNPERVRDMTPALVNALAGLESLDRDQLERNRNAFLERLDDAESDIRQRLATLPPMELFTYHGAFNHFAEHFDVRIAGTLTTNPERNPGARHLAELQHRLENAKAPCIMTEPQFSKDWWQGLNIGKPMGVSHWDPMGADVAIRQGGYTRFLDNLADALVDCRP